MKFAALIVIPAQAEIQKFNKRYFLLLDSHLYRNDE